MFWGRLEFGLFGSPSRGGGEDGSRVGHFLSQGAEDGVLVGFWGELGFGVLLGCVVFKEESVLRREKEGLRDLKKGEETQKREEVKGRVWVLRSGNSDSFAVVKTIFLWTCI